jgi:hypothetical protein
MSLVVYHCATAVDQSSFNIELEFLVKVTVYIIKKQLIVFKINGKKTKAVYLQIYVWCFQGPTNIQYNDYRHNDTQHNDIQHNDTQLNDTQHNETQHNDVQRNDTQHYNIQHNDIQHNSK